MIGRLILLVAWVSLVIPERDKTGVPWPIRHRPGATLITGPTVSSTTGVYRLLIDLPTYSYSQELSEMKSFSNISATSLGQLQALHVRDSEDSFTSLQLKKKLTFLYQDLSNRLRTTTSELQRFCVDLESLQGLEPASLHANSDKGNTTRAARDASDYFGLASTAELAEVNRWVTQLQNSETSLAHSAEKQLSYLNRTMRRLNQQEDRINQLAYVELGWENVISHLREASLVTPTYLDLIITLIHGHSILYHYESYVRPLIQEDLTNLRSLQTHQLPYMLLTSAEFRSILFNAHSHMSPDFAFTASVDYLATQLAQLPVELVRDPASRRLYAKLSIPTRRKSEAFKVVRVLPHPLTGSKLPAVQEIIDIPSDNYIAASTNQFFLLKLNDLFDCNYPNRALRNVMDHEHLCVTPKAYVTYREQEDFYTSCPAALHFDLSTALPNSCKTIIRLAHFPTFIQLIRNVWLYEPGHTGVFRFTCRDKAPPEPINLHPEGGHLVMPPYCEGAMGQFKIPAYTDLVYHVALPNQTHYIFGNVSAQFWISNITDLPPHSQNSKLLAKVRSALSNSKHLTMPLEQFKTELHSISTDLKRNSLSHFLHNNSAAPHPGTLATVFILIALFAGLCAIGKCCWRRRQAHRNRAPQAIPMVTFAPATAPQVISTGQPTISVLPDSPDLPRSNRQLVRRSRSRSRRPRPTV